MRAFGFGFVCIGLWVTAVQGVEYGRVLILAGHLIPLRRPAAASAPPTEPQLGREEIFKAAFIYNMASQHRFTNVAVVGHSHSGCHLDSAGRFSMTSPSAQVILALSSAYSSIKLRFGIE